MVESKQEDEEQKELGDTEAQGSLSFFQIAGSTIAAAFGVQSKRNRERDFNQGKPIHFIIAGIVFTVLFVIAMVVVVNVVLST